ncbi:MAG: hypothetical protein K1X88_23890 [Nannocystaceae bacterium]|nr:hypothetical protein [Nannocystaceae bacterium]
MHSVSLLSSIVTFALHGGPMVPPKAWASMEAPQPTPTATVAPSDTPPAPRTKRRGRGLAIASGAVGAVSLGLGIGRAMMVRHCLDDLADGNVGSCRRGGAFTGLRVGQAIGNLSTLGLVIGTGVVAGLYDGEAGVRGRGRVRKPGAFIGTGAAAIVAGAAIQLGGLIGGLRAFVKPECLSLAEDSQLGHCVAKGVTIALVTNQLGASVTQVGAGLLTYGIANHKGAERGRRVARLRVSPIASLSRGGNATFGLTLSGRF